MHEHEYETIKQVIKKASENALRFLGLSWRFQISHPYSEFQIDFFDGKPYQCDVHFELPPNPDEEWYTQEIIRQLQEKCLGGSNQ